MPAFNTPSYYWNRGVWFQMPFGYRNPRPSSDYANAMIDRERYGQAIGLETTQSQNDNLMPRPSLDGVFLFWMPSLRWVEINHLNTPDSRPCEAGREPPGPDEYVVYFRIDWPFLPDSESASETRQFRRAIERVENGEPLTLQNAAWAEHSMNGPITGTSRHYSIFFEDESIVVMFLCNAYRGEWMPVNPLCSGHVWAPQLDLVLFIHFPSDQGQFEYDQRWRQPVEAAIRFALEWKDVEADN